MQLRIMLHFRVRFIRGFGLFFIFCFIAEQVIAQFINISGFVEEASTKERITATVVSYNNNSVITNDAGYFSIKVKKNDSVLLLFSHAEYQLKNINLTLSSDTFITVTLTPRAKELAEIQIQSSRNSNALGTISLPIRKIEKIPALFGEKDIIRAIQLLPGVQSGSEGSTGYYVRGGGADQNLILLDGITIYNVSHLFGFLSLFPPEAVKSVDLIKGGFPARYGGRLSSVLDIKLKDGNKHNVTGNYSIGLLSSKVSVEGPIEKGKSSFMVTARRTYIDLLVKPFLVNKPNQGGYFFYDGIAKLNFKLNQKNNLSVSVYNGRDRFTTITKETQENGSAGIINKVTSETNLEWGNFTAAIKLNNTISGKLNINHIVHYTSFDYKINYKRTAIDPDGNSVSQKNFSFNYLSSIKDLGIKSNADWYVSNKLKITSGVGYTRHFFVPSSASLSGGQISQTTASSKIQTNESYLFSEADFSPTKKISINTGVHTTIYSVGSKNFFSVQPRIRNMIQLNSTSQLQFSFATMLQPIHLLTNNGPGLPIDLWVPATQKIPPQKSIQYTIGYSIKPGKAYEFSLEAYYKKMNGVIEYAEGASFLNSTLNWEERVEKGKGVSYGTEFFLQKKTGVLSGWIGYTLSWSKRRFTNLNEGNWFWYKYDHRHDLKVVALYQPTNKFDASFSFVLNSGNRVTVPDVIYTGVPGTVPLNYAGFLFDTDPQFIFNASSRNNETFKTYHRADISFNFNKEKKRGTRTWNISIYNFYSRLNTYFYYYKETQNRSLTLTAFTLFPIIPSFSYQFKWK
ncbi:MAG: TonB-dependent receptor plug domain-containing protein [Chitinophagaceae bacterium]|nr:TonB-dependent receptor plug domain-containing protein [Chitinophagaceae bacterium]